jgi:DNA-directed RNA polymerase specialized sigma24 family protein
VTTEFSELYGQFAGHVLAYARRHANRDDPEDVVAETFHVAWRRRELVELPATLPDHEREALLLVAWDDLSAEQAARVLGISAGAVRVRIHRARKRLQAVKEALDA